MLRTLGLLAVAAASASAADLYWVGASSSLNSDIRWTGGVNPFTTQVSQTTFGSSQPGVGQVGQGGTVLAGNRIRFGGSFRLQLAGTPSSPARLNLGAAPGAPQASTQALSVDYRSAYNWNNPLNWATTPGGNTHPANPPQTADTAHFPAGATPSFASTFGATASVGAITDDAGTTLTACAGEVGTPTGQLIGSTVVSIAPCNQFSFGSGPNGAAAWPPQYFDTAAPLADGSNYRVVTIYNGPAAAGNNGEPWVYRIVGNQYVGPVSNFAQLRPQLPCQFGAGNCAPTVVPPPTTHAPVTVAPTTDAPTVAQTFPPSAVGADWGGSLPPTSYPPTTDAPVTVAPTTSAPTTRAPVEASSSGSDGVGGSGISLLLMIVIIAVIVVVAVVAFVVFRNGGSKSDERVLQSQMDNRGKGVGFENPLYESGDATAGADYMDVTPGTEPAGTDALYVDNDPSGGYGEAGDAADAAEGGYLDLDDEGEDDY